MKRKSLKVFIFFFVIWGSIFSTIAVPAGARANRNSQVKIELRTYFHRLAKNESFSGSVLVAREGEILLKGGYKMANHDTGQPNRPATVFAVASMTKAFTAMAIMILAERGLLSVDDAVAGYIPGFPNGDRITIHHLLTHTSGLYEFLANATLWGNTNDFHIPDQLLPYFVFEPLNFEPGSQFSYCNSNYITLGIIIERVSGMSYREFIRTDILKPLGMNHTSYDPYEIDFPRKAVGYDTLEPPVAAMYFHPSIAFSAGAIYSKVTDLYKWDQALYTERLVSAATLERMFTPGLGDYGCGWYIDNLEIDGRLHKQVWHWGSYFGFHSHISRLVDDNVTIIILCNTPSPTGTPGALEPIVKAAASIIFANNRSGLPLSDNAAVNYGNEQNEKEIKGLKNQRRSSHQH